MKKIAIATAFLLTGIVPASAFPVLNSATAQIETTEIVQTVNAQKRVERKQKRVSNRQARKAQRQENRKARVEQRKENRQARVENRKEKRKQKLENRKAKIDAKLAKL